MTQETKELELVWPLKGGLMKVLEEVLAPGEAPLVVLPGMSGEALAVTRSRVYVLKAGLSAGGFGGKKVKAFPISQITSVEVSRSMMSGRLQISAAGTSELPQVANLAALAMAENVVSFGTGTAKPSYAEFAAAAQVIRDLVDESKRPTHSPSSVSDLAKLAELWAQGALTDDEFKAAKSRLLGL